jgi:RNA polymerase sigma-70 factor (ECF subfamily)
MTGAPGARRGRTSLARGGPEVVTDVALVVLGAYESHRSELYGFLIRATRDRELAEDLLQETFARLLREARAGRRPSDPRAWLFRVAANLAVSSGRRQQALQRWAPFLARHDDHLSAEQSYLQRETSDRVEAALKHVSPDARAALLLAAHGAGTAEVARAIGRTELATRSLLCRSRLKLRDHLQETER